MLNGDTGIADDRGVIAPGIYNMRDVGGLPTTSGKPMRRGVFFRADNLGWLQPEGVDHLRDLGIRTIIDLRMSTEIIRHPNPFSQGEEPRYLNVDLVGREVAPEDRHENDGQWYRRERPDGSREFPTYSRTREYCHWLATRAPQFLDILSTLADPAAAPVIFHCMGGKDRTGVTAALLQALAGVPDYLIANDYGQTAENNIERYLEDSWRVLSVKTAADYRREFCTPETILMVLFWLRDRFGSVEQYMESIGMATADVDTLRERLSGVD